MHDDVGAAERALHHVLDAVGDGMGLPHARVERHSNHEVDEVAPARLAHAHAAHLHVLLGLRERGADALVGLGHGPVHQHVDRLLREPQRRDDDE